MKKIICCIIIAFTLFGCNSEKGKLSSNEEYLALLDNDDKFDFILEGEYYEMPFELSLLIKKGWEIDEYYSEREMIELDYKEYSDFITYYKDGYVLTVQTFNPYEETIFAYQGLVYSLSLARFESAEEIEDFIVIKNGITMGTSIKTVAKETGCDSKTRECSYLYVPSIPEARYSFDYDSKSSRIRTIEMNYNISELGYISYKDGDKVELSVEEKIANYKNQAYENTNKYLPDKYDQLLAEIKKSNYKEIQIYLKGTVIDTYEAVSDSSSFEKTVYIVESKDGYYFAIEFSMKSLYEFEIDDEIEIWANVTPNYLSDSRGELIIVAVSIVNVDGIEDYNRFTGDYNLK